MQCSEARGVSFCRWVWCGVVWCGVVWCGVVWCGVVWCGVVWCGVVWCGGSYSIAEAMASVVVEWFFSIASCAMSFSKVAS